MNEGLIIPLAGIMLPMVLVPTVITLSHRFKKREWQHKERLRAIELGVPVPGTESRLNGGSVTAIGAGVPAASVLAAFLTTVNIPYDHDEFVPILAITWGFAFFISTGAMITSLVLGGMLSRSAKAARPADEFAAYKPAMDPDAYDVVSSRG
jgi:hypothetical protein